MSNKITITSKDKELIQRAYPFLTCMSWQGKELIGIVQNTNDKMISFYNYEKIPTAEQKRLFLECGESWWNESNRLLPINIFMQGAMSQFRECLQTFKLKETEILFGPVTSLNNLLTKRIKRRQIKLIIKN